MPFGVLPSTWHPALYALSVWEKRLRRHARWWLEGASAAERTPRLPYRVFKHTSKLVRRAPGVDLALQLGKVQNLKVAVPLVHEVLVRPGQTFSLCQLVGRPTRARGFVEGMELSRGVARAGVGGGLCQLANLLHWLVLHSPLTVVERHHHSLDPFPDSGRVVPFGSGATIFYNYLDLRFRNDTAADFQVRVWLTDRLLEGELRSAQPWPYKYRVYEEGHRFFREGGQVYRANQLWREVRREGAVVRREFLFAHEARVLYTPAPDVVVEPGRRPSPR